MHKFIDKLLVLLPFEAELFNGNKLPAVFVGHPVATDEDFEKPPYTRRNEFLESIGVRRKSSLKEDRVSIGICADIPDGPTPDCRSEYAEVDGGKDTSSNDLVITLLPGSRPSEIKSHLPILAEFANLMLERYKNVKFIIPTVESLKTLIDIGTQDWPQRPMITTNKSEKVLAYYVSKAAVAASGTVTLELSRVGLPFVAIYKTSAITAAIVKYLIKIKHVCLVNILAQRGVVPELLQNDCTAQNIFAHLTQLLDSDIAQRQVESFSEIMDMLKTEEPLLAAKEIIKTIA
jgi:lipid A disaccharide synthetase